MGGPVSIDDQSLYDWRYFYVDQRGIGTFACGIALEIMASLLQEQDITQFKDDSCYSAVSQSPNPVVQGFLAKKICLSSIAATGLKAVHPELDRMSTAFFEDHPNFDKLISSDGNACVYFSTAYIFRAVDAVILLLDRPSKQATMIPIRFSLMLGLERSDRDFYARFWSSWREPMKWAGYSVRSTFVWIDREQPSEADSEYFEPELVKSLRSGDRLINPEYSVVRVGVEMVDRRLASALGVV